jgi:carbon monoxide dehydrogenase subunit G
MLVKLEKTFPIDAPANAAWSLLQDIQSVAACMPGAQITERVDDRHYKGQVSVRMGPVSATFKGAIEIQDIDASQRHMRMVGKGSDTSGTSAASMDLTAVVRTTTNGKTELVGVSEVTVTGKLASFGGRMMTQVSDQLLKQFGANFANRVVAMGEGAAAQQAAARMAEQPRELNALALLWHVIVGFFRSLFGRGKSKPAG